MHKLYNIKRGRVSCYYRLIHLFFLVIMLFSVGAKANTSNVFAVFTLNPEFAQLTKNKVRMLYRGKTKYLQGKKIELSDWPQNTHLRNQFYQKLLGKDTAQMNAYWASLSFSGKARPPKEINNNTIEALLIWMSEKSSRIGYARLNALPDNANVLYIVGKENE